MIRYRMKITDSMTLSFIRNFDKMDINAYFGPVNAVFFTTVMGIKQEFQDMWK